MKTRYLLFGLLLGIVFLAACIKFTPPSPTGQAVNPPLAEDCTLLNSSSHIDDCYLEKKQCSKINDPSVKNECIGKLAVLKEDIKVCDLIQDLKSRGSCQETLAEKAGNSEICYTITDSYWSENCFRYFAIKENNNKFCWKLLLAHERDSCLSEVAKSSENYEICKEIYSEEKKNRLFLPNCQEKRQD